jgi:hypothetical protein
MKRRMEYIKPVQLTEEQVKRADAMNECVRRRAPVGLFGRSAGGIAKGSGEGQRSGESLV